MEHDREWNYLSQFISIYHETMRRNNAAPFYFFSREYFLALKASLGSRGSLLVSLRDGEVAGALLLIECDGIATIHLAASDQRFSKEPVTKQLFHEAQLLAAKRGSRLVHIGGGRGSRDDDPLFRFKKLFSNNFLPFYTGRWVLDLGQYELLTSRSTAYLGPSRYEDLAASYFPGYRSQTNTSEATQPGTPQLVFADTAVAEKQ